jgi:lysophospholipase L1-like esterase
VAPLRPIAFSFAVPCIIGFACIRQLPTQPKRLKCNDAKGRQEERKGPQCKTESQNSYLRVQSVTMKSIFLIILVAFASICSAQITTKRLNDTISYIPDHYAKRIALFEQEPVVTGKVLFLGNSITEGGKWTKLLNDPTIINRGISGDITYGVLKRLPDIINRKPSKLFLLIGINDIAKDIPDEVIADNIRKIIQRIKAASPDTKIFLQSILPLNPGVPGFPQHYDKEDHVFRTNQLLREVARQADVNFLNLFPIFADREQRLQREFTYDGLHLNEKGYEVWAKFLKDSGVF